MTTDPLDLDGMQMRADAAAARSFTDNYLWEDFARPLDNVVIRPTS